MILQKLTEEQVNNILAALNLSASSFGLQPYKFILVNDPEVREKLKNAAFGQTQVTDASHLIVFAHKTSMDHGFIENTLTILLQPEMFHVKH